MYKNLGYRSQINLSVVTGFLALALFSFVGWIYIPGGVISSEFAQKSVFLYAFPLMVFIFYVAYKRGHNQHLVDGYLANDADIEMHKACLQNTLEQTVLAVPLVLSIQMIAPALAPKIVVMHLVTFLLGRFLFWFGYRSYPSLRFPGFVVTYYASVALFVLCIVLWVQ